MPSRSKVWITVAGALVLCQVASSLLLPKSFQLTAISDLVQAALLLCCTVALVPNIPSTQGRVRVFWALMMSGSLLWFSYQILWTYFEVVLRRDVPDPFAGDVVIFLHLVPMMAAPAFQPHLQRDQRTTRLRSLDLAILLIWWIFLYLYAVIPWQYAAVNVDAYDRSLNILYAVEKTALLAVLGWVWFRSNQPWKTVYLNFFGASFTYALSSYVANWAIHRGSYYSGSIYDIPLAASIGWMTWAALSGRQVHRQESVARESSRPHLWVARLGMIAILSLPLFAAASFGDMQAPAAVRNFRLIICLATILVMGSMVYIRQHLLDRELLSLLEGSRQSFQNLQVLQAQLVQTEKLASLGQLVSGAAHELNNPLTAMLGYSELLLESSGEGAQRSIAEKVGDYIRNTNVLIAGLLSFARQSPSQKKALDLNGLVQTAAKISEPQFHTAGVSLRPKLAANLPRVGGDSNQLLQVCLNVMKRALAKMPKSGGTLELCTSEKDGSVCLDFISSAESWPNAGAHDATRRLSGNLLRAVGLETFLPILQNHDARVAVHNAHVLGIELPVYSLGAESEKRRSVAAVLAAEGAVTTPPIVL